MKILEILSGIISLQFTVFPCKFRLPQGKWNLISCVLVFVCKLPRKLSSEVRIKIIRNRELKRKSQKWVLTQASVQSVFQKLVSGNSCQILCKTRYQRFLVWFAFLDFLTLYEVLYHLS